MYKKNQSLEISFQPIFYFFLLFTSGILIENFLNFSIKLLISGLIVNFLLIVFSRIKNYQKYLSLLLLIGFFLVGCLLNKIENDKTYSLAQKIDREVYSNFNRNQQIEIYGEVLNYPKLTPNAINIDVITHFVNRTNHTVNLSAKIRLTIWKGNLHQNINLTPGTFIYTKAELLPEQKFKNPGVINSRQILLQQGYYFSIVLKDLSQLEVLFQKPSSIFSTTFYQIKNHILGRIEQNFNPEKAGVLKAIILGDDNYIEPSIAEKFRASGLYHILVISGSHIAFLTWVLYKLVSLVTKNQWLKFIVICSLIWIYALIAGAEPPLIRAVLMTTVVLSGALWHRKASPSNNIGIAGIILLAYHPGALFEASFQLTFLAVALILLIILPLVENLEKIGKWYPSSQTPYPPDCSPSIKWVAELLFWSEKTFVKKQKESQIKYKLEKNPWAIALEKYKVQILLRLLSLMLITSFIVHIGILPLSIIYFHRVAFIGIFFNIISEILMSILLLIIVIFFVVDYISYSLGYYLVFIIDFLLSVFISSAWPDFFSTLNQGFPIFSYRVAGFSSWQNIIYIFYFICLIIILIVLNNWKPFTKPRKLILASRKIFNKSFFNKFLILFTSICLLIIVLPQHFYKKFFENKTNKLEVVFLDVGQGDAIFIEFPQGTRMIIDSGGNDVLGKENKSSFSIGEQVDSMYLWSRGIEHLDYIVVTHPHNDHIEGFTKIIENFSIGQAIVPQVFNQNSEWQSFINAINSNNIALKTWSNGEFFIDGVKVEVLWPTLTQEIALKNTLSKAPNKVVNNASLVVRLSYQGHSILLTGDIEKETENFLANSNLDLSAEVIKVPHHGSKTSSSKNFLEKVKPKISIVSAPVKSRFNHPHLEVVERYKNINTEVYQTGLSGAITVFIENNKLHLREFVYSNK